MTFEEWWNTKDYPDCCLLRCKRAFNEGRAELEKENAELKKEVLEVRQHLDLTEREWGKDTTKLIHFKTQLTKAIGIIKRWYETNRSACIEPSQELIEVTEQFLKEIEK